MRKNKLLFAGSTIKTVVLFVLAAQFNTASAQTKNETAKNECFYCRPDGQDDARRKNRASLTSSPVAGQ